MCTCDDNPVTEEYRTAYPDFETSILPEWRTSTRYYDEAEGVPEYISPSPRRIPQRDIRRSTPLRRIPRRPDLTAGVAIVPRRIDFDAVPDIEHFEDEGDLGFIAAETLQRLRDAAQHPETATPGTYSLRRSRPTQFPPQPARQHAPRMTRITPCGKCLRI